MFKSGSRENWRNFAQLPVQADNYSKDYGS